MVGISSASSIKYGNYEVIKTNKDTAEKVKSDLGLVDLGTTKDNVLDLTNPDKLMAELTQDKVKFIKVSEGLYLKLDLSNPAETKKLLADIKNSIKKEKNLGQDFSPLVFEKALGLQTTAKSLFQAPEKAAVNKYNEVVMANSRVKDLEFYTNGLEKLNNQIAGDTEYFLENPETGNKDIDKDLGKVRENIDSLFKAFRRDLFSNTGQYGNIDPLRELEYSNNPGFKVMEALQNLIPKDYKPGKPLPPEKMKEVEALLEKVDKKSPEYEKLKDLVNTLKPALEMLAYEKRVIPGYYTERKTIQKAEQLAHDNPGKAYGIVDGGRGADFMIVEYPASLAKEKLHQVYNSAGSLVAFSALEGDQVKTASRLADKKISSGVLSSDFRSSIGDKRDKVDPRALDDPARQTEILNKVSDKAVEIVSNQYNSVLKRYNDWTTDYPDNPPPGNQDPNVATVEKSDLVNLVFQLGKSGRRDIEDQVAQLFKVERRSTGTDLRAAQISEFHDAYEKAGTREQKLAVIHQYKDLFDGLKASVKECIPKIEKERTKLLTGERPEAGFTALKDYPSVRQEVYRQLGFKLDSGKFPPIQSDDMAGYSALKLDETIYKENAANFTSTAELVYARRVDEWDFKDKAVRGTETAGIVVGSIIATLVFKIPPVWAAVGGAAVGSGLEIADAKNEADKTRVKYYGNFAGEKDMQQADIKFGLSIVSGILNIGAAAVGARLNSESILKGLGQDFLINLTQAGVDPSTYYGAKSAGEVFERIKSSMTTNVVMGGTLSGIHVAGGKVLGKVAEHFQAMKGQKVEARINSETGELLIKPKGAPDSQAVKIPKENIQKAEDGKLEFKVPGSDALVSMDVDTVKLGFLKKTGEVQPPPSPAKAPQKNIGKVPDFKSGDKLILKGKGNKEFSVIEKKPDGKMVIQEVDNNGKAVGKAYPISKEHQGNFEKAPVVSTAKTDPNIPAFKDADKTQPDIKIKGTDPDKTQPNIKINEITDPDKTQPNFKVPAQDTGTFKTGDKLRINGGTEDAVYSVIGKEKDGRIIIQKMKSDGSLEGNLVAVPKDKESVLYPAKEVKQGNTIKTPEGRQITVDKLNPDKTVDISINGRKFQVSLEALEKLKDPMVSNKPGINEMLGFHKGAEISNGTSKFKINDIKADGTLVVEKGGNKYNISPETADMIRKGETVPPGLKIGETIRAEHGWEFLILDKEPSGKVRLLYDSPSGPNRKYTINPLVLEALAKNANTPAPQLAKDLGFKIGDTINVPGERKPFKVVDFKADGTMVLANMDKIKQIHLKAFSEIEIKQPLKNPGTVTPLPTAEFNKKVPLPESKESYNRTEIDLKGDGEKWAVTGYNKDTGMAVLEKTEVKAPLYKEDPPGNFILEAGQPGKTDHIKITSSDPYKLKPGDIVTDDNGFKWRVDTINEHNSERVGLSRVERIEVEGRKLINDFVDKGKATVHSEVKPSAKIIDRVKLAVQVEIRKTLNPDNLETVKLVGENNVSVDLGNVPKKQEIFRQSEARIKGLDPLVQFSDLKKGDIVKNAGGLDCEITEINWKEKTVKFKNLSTGAETPKPMGLIHDPVEAFEVKMSVKLPGNKTHEMHILIPTEGKAALTDEMKKAVENLRKTIEKLPAGEIDNLKKIKINTKANLDDAMWHEQGKFKEGQGSYATGGSSEINFYPVSHKDLHEINPNFFETLHDTIAHELGHLIAKKHYNSYVPDKNWERAMRADRTFTTGYSQTGHEEDFAETVAKYILSDGGKKAIPGEHPNLREKYGERFKILDELFKANPKEAQLIKAQVGETVHFAKMGAAGAGAAVIVSGTGILVINELTKDDKEKK
jgi:hypothetical protein